MKVKTVYLSLVFSLVLLLSSCATDIPQEQGVPQDQYDAIVSDRDEKISEMGRISADLEDAKKTIAERDGQIADLQSQLSEQDALYQKYKDLSDSEVLAQTEANNRKAEEDRIAAEQLLAEETAKKEAEEAAKREAEEAEAKKGYETGITFDNLSRNPDDYEGKKVKFTGVVIQVLEGDGLVTLRIATRGNYDDVILVAYEPGIVSSRVLEDDKITIYGTSRGLHTYQSTMGGSITIPLIAVDKIDQ